MRLLLILPFLIACGTELPEDVASSTLQPQAKSEETKTEKEIVEVVKEGPTCQVEESEDGAIIWCPGQKSVRVRHGKDGIDGQDGQDGKDGEDGEKGEQGIQGEKGEKGERGEQGEQGIAGEDGFLPTRKWTSSNASSEQIHCIDPWIGTDERFQWSEDELVGGTHCRYKDIEIVDLGGEYYFVSATFEARTGDTTKEGLSFLDTFTRIVKAKDGHLFVELNWHLTRANRYVPFFFDWAVGDPQLFIIAEYQSYRENIAWISMTDASEELE